MAISLGILTQHFQTNPDPARSSHCFRTTLRCCPTHISSSTPGLSASRKIDESRGKKLSHYPWRIHGAAIYGVPWIPSIYPLYVSINIAAPWIRHGLRIALLVDLVYLGLLYHTKNPIYIYIYMREKSINQLVRWDGIDGYSVHGSLSERDDSEREIFGMGYSGDLTIKHADYADLTQKNACRMIASELYTILQNIAILLYIYIYIT